MKKAIIATFLALLAIGVQGSPFELGGTKIHIPTPEEHTEVSPQMEKVWPLVQAAQGENHLLVLFIPKQEAAIALNGKVPNLDRNINVQVRRKFEGASINSATFEQVKNQVLKLVASRQANDLQAKELERFNGNIKKATSIDLRMKQTSNISLPPHVSSTDEFGYSEISTQEGVMPDGSVTSMQTTATAISLLVKGKLLNCYVTGGPDDLTWTRETAARLAAAIRRANWR
ncbi:TPA: hypothetical protein R4278_005612 [Citrobacter freundii]|nr:hypothetical protein [Citrobacter freundii]HED4095223.1 hypothetical protein [Citrobacter freundii]